MATPTLSKSGERILPGTTVGGHVGTFSIPITVYSHDRSASRSLDGLVDTGSIHTIVPAGILEELEIPVFLHREYRLADGSMVSLALGAIQIELQGEIAAVQVLFGIDPEHILIGATTLETFGYAVDPHHRRLIPAELTL